LRTSIRKEDALSRYGGEKFAIFLNNCTLQTGIKKSKDICRKIAKTEIITKQRITISIGLTESLKDDTPATIFERANKALYQAKEKGRNRIEYTASTLS
jgi:diguanylate cyclase (GGDEF)-like protein